METLIWPSISLFTLIAILVYYLREPLKEMISSRHLTVLGEVKHAQAMLHQSQEQYEEFSAKLKAIHAEVAALHEQMKADAQDSRNRIVAEAKEVGQQVTRDAKLACQYLVEEFRGHLCSEFGAKVLVRAEELMLQKMGVEDKKRFNKDFAQNLESTL